MAQLEMSFQLRIRRLGVKSQFITFDPWKPAEQTRLQIDANLSVSIVLDHAVAAHVTLRELMQRYLEEVVRQHQGKDVEANC